LATPEYIQKAGGVTEDEKYITQLYRDLLQRDPAQSEVDGFARAFHEGASHEAVALTILTSDEYYTALIGEQYQHLLGRSAAASEIAPWVRLLREDGDIGRLQAGLISSDEAFSHTGGINTAWLGSAYQALLGRAIDQEGLRIFSAALDSGASRFDVALGILRS